MSYKYNDLEKEFLRKMLKDISWEHSTHGNMKNSDDFAWRLFQTIDWTIRQILDHKDTKFIGMVNGLIPPKRGEEECDCTKSLGNCGCRVRAYNECREEIKFATSLAKQTITGEKIKDENN